MKPILLILGTLLLLSSCSMQRYCERHFPPKESVDTVQNTVTIVKHDTVYYDTIIPVPIPGDITTDTVKLPDSVVNSKYVSNETLRSLHASAHTSLAEAEAYMQVHPPRIVLLLTQKDTTLQIKLDSALMRIDYWKDKYLEVQKTKVKVEKYIPKFYKFTLWWFIGTLVLFCFYLIIKIK